MTNKKTAQDRIEILYRATSRPVLAGLAFLMTVGLGCSRETSIYPDPAPPADTAIVSPGQTDTRFPLPDDFYNHSVNRASIQVQPDGVSATSKAFHFKTESDANSADSFNGSGTGNRAILGFSPEDLYRSPLATADILTFDARSFAGTEKISIHLQVDLLCNGSSLHVLTADSELLSNSPESDGYTRFTADQSAAIWRADHAIVDPDSANILVPAAGAAASLDALKARYTAACLRTGITNAADLPKGIPTAAIQWALGSDDTTTQNSVFVRRLSIGSEVFEGLE
ncbi:MAG: hypothetical protein RBT63_03080 [Bdellovibrionales bacterium]|nr:hypothetical protein [Bdellovibrionales bacterium]